MGSLHSLLPLLPVRSALDFIAVQPDTEGRIILTVVIKGEETHLEFLPWEVEILEERLAEARETAEGLPK
jgi:hypothetical protein